MVSLALVYLQRSYRSVEDMDEGFLLGLSSSYASDGYICSMALHKLSPSKNAHNIRSNLCSTCTVTITNVKILSLTALQITLALVVGINCIIIKNRLSHR